MKNLLSSLPGLVTHKKKRLGRGLGSGKGAKSTRGTTRHQKARESIPLHFEGGQNRLVKRFPLLRGKGKNTSKRQAPIILTASRLNIFSDGDVVNAESLIKKKIIEPTMKKRKKKIIAGGKLLRKLEINIPVSESVKKETEKLGGSVTTA